MSELIDRQALRAAHGLGSDCHDCKRDMKSCQYDRDYSLMDFCEWLDDAPAASPWHRVEEELPKDDCEVFTASRLPFDKTDTWIYDHSFFTTDVSECEELKDEYPNEHKAAFYKWSDISDKYVICHYGLKYWMMPIEPPKEDA